MFFVKIRVVRTALETNKNATLVEVCEEVENRLIIIMNENDVIFIDEMVLGIYSHLEAD